MKIHHLSIFALCFFSVPALADFICTEGIMDKKGWCHSCNSVYEIEPRDINQALKRCPNRFLDLCGKLKLKCNDKEEPIENRCLPICKDGYTRSDDGRCYPPQEEGTIFISYDDYNCPLTVIVRSPFIMSDEEAKNLICNDGVLDIEGLCWPCSEKVDIDVQNPKIALKNCPNRLMDECGYSKLKCGTDEEKIGNKCFQKCKDGFTRNKNNECCNQNTGECITKQCPMYI